MKKMLALWLLNITKLLPLILHDATFLTFCQSMHEDFLKCSFIRPFVLWSVIFVFMVFSLGSLCHLSVLSKIGSFPTPPDVENLRVNKTQKWIPSLSAKANPASNSSMLKENVLLPFFLVLLFIRFYISWQCIFSQ